MGIGGRHAVVDGASALNFHQSALGIIGVCHGFGGMGDPAKCERGRSDQDSAGDTHGSLHFNHAESNRFAPLDKAKIRCFWAIRSECSGNYFRSRSQGISQCICALQRRLPRAS